MKRGKGFATNPTITNFVFIFSGWIFEKTQADSINWYNTWDAVTNVDHIRWDIAAEQWQPVLSLAFFTLILVPIRLLLKTALH